MVGMEGGLVIILWVGGEMQLPKGTILLGQGNVDSIESFSEIGRLFSQGFGYFMMFDRMHLE